LSSKRGTWGYSRVSTADELASRYERLMQAIHTIGLLSGFCYTQFADTYQEANGLLYTDRRPKFPLAEICEATRGWREAEHQQGAPVSQPQAGSAEAPGQE